jgi:uncharacterized spore protein YtfJ
MSSQSDTIARAAAAMPSARGTDALSALADRVGASLGGSHVFGTPVERDGVTVVPVGRTRFGFGGGSGGDPAKQQQGEGGGAGATGECIGYIELLDGSSRFVPAVRPARMLALASATLLLALALVRVRIEPRPARRRRPLRG